MKQKVKKLKTNGARNYYRQKDIVFKLCDKWRATAKQGKKFQNMDHIIKHAIKYCVDKYNVPIGHTGTLDPYYYKYHLEKGNLPGLNIMLHDEDIEGDVT